MDSKLKLFVSHSSRLDDIDHSHTSEDRNWQLLRNTCQAIREHYSDKVDVLVDKDGLIPGEDWNHQLNLWLAECHVAVILFSKRAIEKSDWVAKEAAILSWRRELDPKFILIPALLDGESTPEDLAKDFFGTLKIDTNQCIRGAQTAQDILDGLVHKLGGPEDLAARLQQTPLEQVTAGFAAVLDSGIPEVQLEAALSALGVELGTDFHADKKAYTAFRLARHLFLHDIDHFDSFKRGIDPLIPGPLMEQVRALFRQIRSLWVDPCAAGIIPRALDHKRPLAMEGALLAYSDPILETRHYTFDRYIERAWAGSTQYCAIPVDTTMTIDQVQTEIRTGFWGPLPPGFTAAMLDQTVNADLRVILLFVQSANPESGLPDPRFLKQLKALQKAYHKLVIVLQSGNKVTELPEGIDRVAPSLDPAVERNAFGGERTTQTFLNQKYGIQHEL